MKSRLISFPRLPGKLAGRAGAVSARLSEDLVALSAARAAFFLLTSAVPFLSLAAALTGFLLPDPLPETALPEVLTKGGAGELFRLLASQIMNVLTRPDFIAAEAVTDHSLPLRLLRLFPAHWAAWTVRSQEQMDGLRGRYEIQIFEGFIPREDRP